MGPQPGRIQFQYCQMVHTASNPYPEPCSSRPWSTDVYATQLLLCLDTGDTTPPPPSTISSSQSCNCTSWIKKFMRLIKGCQFQKDVQDFCLNLHLVRWQVIQAIPLPLSMTCPSPSPERRATLLLILEKWGRSALFQVSLQENLGYFLCCGTAPNQKELKFSFRSEFLGDRKGEGGWCNSIIIFQPIPSFPKSLDCL